MVRMEQHITSRTRPLELIQSAYHGLLEQRAVLIAHMNSHLLLLAPISRLPDEVLLELFDLCCVSDDGFMQVSIESPLETLSTVCSRWRGIMTGTAKFWSSLGLELHVCNPCPTKVRLLKKWLAFSGTRPVSLNLTVYEPGSRARFLQPGEITYATVTLVAMMWKYAPRLKSLKAIIPVYSAAMESAITRLLYDSGSIPLDSLILEGRNEWELLQDPGNQLLSQLPNLQYLQLSGFASPATLQRTPTLFGLSTVKSLILTNMGAAQLPNVLNILISSPQLTKCVLEYDQKDPPLSAVTSGLSTKILYLLADLSLMTQRPEGVLQSFALPQLRRLACSKWIEPPFHHVEQLARRSHLGHRIVAEDSEARNCTIALGPVG